MAKGILKFTLAVLLAVLLVMIPLLGIPQLGFSGLLTDDDITISNELAEGQLVHFALAADTNKNSAEVLKQNADKTAQILRRRLSALGYSDSDVSVVSNRDIILTLPFNTDTSVVKEKLAITGDFLFKDSNGKTIISSKDIESCVPFYNTGYDSNGNGTVSYYLAFYLTEDALKLYTEKTTEIAKSTNKYIELFVDSTSLSRLNVDSAVTENGFSFGPFEYADALWYSTMINAGPAPQTIAPATYSVEPVLGNGAFSMLFAAALIALVILCAAGFFFLGFSGLTLTLSTVCTLGMTLILNTVFALGVSLSSVAAVALSAVLCILVTTVLLRNAKAETASNPYTCLKLAFKKSVWLLVDLLALPFAVALAMMWYGNVFTMLFANLLFIAVVSTAFSLLITLLTVSALADLGKKRACAFGKYVES